MLVVESGIGKNIIVAGVEIIVKYAFGILAAVTPQVNRIGPGHRFVEIPIKTEIRIETFIQALIVAAFIDEVAR
jgi:hypothetical protein